MTKKVIMFPGQGSQYKGMGRELFLEFPQTVKTASDILGYDVAELCLNNTNYLLNQTNYTQPAVFLVNYLHYQKYLKSNQGWHYLLGHSLGEFNALNAAGVFDFESGLRIVKERGELMFSVSGTGMAAIIGSDYGELNEILQGHFPDIDIANINTRSQIVISGPLTSLSKASEHFEEEGFVFIPLKVSGAFHSRYMTPLKEKFQNFLNGIDLRKCEVPVISNCMALPYPIEREAIMMNMVNQIDSPVKWLNSIEYLLAQGECEFKELGPGEVLTNTIKKIVN